MEFLERERDRQTEQEKKNTQKVRQEHIEHM